MATDAQYLAGGGPAKDSGCTAVAAVLIGNKLAVANVGDSRAVLSRNSQGAPRQGLGAGHAHPLLSPVQLISCEGSGVQRLSRAARALKAIRMEPSWDRTPV